MKKNYFLEISTFRPLNTSNATNLPLGSKDSSKGLTSRITPKNNFQNENWNTILYVPLHLNA